MNLILKVKRVVADAKLPTQGRVGDAAYDLYAAETVELQPGERCQVGAGIAVEIPEEYAMFIWDRSSVSHLHGLKTLGGVIDAIYRGEVKVGLVNVGEEPYTIEKGHRIAQFVLQQVAMMQVEEVETLSETVRGEKGFGSTGK